MAKKQYHLTYNLFEELPNLKDEFKPIYYTLLKLLNEEYPNEYSKEYLKVGEELEETINEIEILVKLIAG
jgi:hypothetical protein